MVGSGDIAVTFDDIEGAAAAVRAVAGNIDTLLADLRIMLRPLVAEWDGAAAINYQYQQHVWDGATEDLHGVLLRIADTLTKSHGAYIGAESEAHNMWGGG